MEIKFCENNFSQGTEAVAKKIRKEFSSIDVEVEACLGYCSDCAVKPYALVDDEMVIAETADNLYEKIVEMLNE
ncbi:MAG: DUF1450 domain-containing protein [Vallitaleaceae bacterium]|nr:DUF1450 domain-containing protein [Vallitaleaceae bacterium]